MNFRFFSKTKSYCPVFLRPDKFVLVCYSNHQNFLDHSEACSRTCKRKSRQNFWDGCREVENDYGNFYGQYHLRRINRSRHKANQVETYQESPIQVFKFFMRTRHILQLLHPSFKFKQSFCSNPIELTEKRFHKMLLFAWGIPQHVEPLNPAFFRIRVLLVARRVEECSRRIRMIKRRKHLENKTNWFHGFHVFGHIPSKKQHFVKAFFSEFNEEDNLSDMVLKCQ